MTQTNGIDATLESVIRWNKVEDELPATIQDGHFRNSDWLLLVARGEVRAGILRITPDGKKTWTWCGPLYPEYSDVILWAYFPVAP